MPHPRRDRPHALHSDPHIHAQVLRATALLRHQIERSMQEQGVTRAELARRMQVSPSHVSQLLGGPSANWTLSTLVQILHALGLRLEVPA